MREMGQWLGTKINTRNLARYPAEFEYRFNCRYDLTAVLLRPAGLTSPRIG
jgi:hypothetical protein